jgi:hypothetical protein
MYIRIAPDSKIEIGLPSGPSLSTMAGILLLGLIFRKSGLNCSPVPMLTGMVLNLVPVSSSRMVTL